MRVYWSLIALERIEEILEFIELDSPPAARRWLLTIFKSADRLKKFPKSGRIVSEISRPDIREVIKGAYRIIYRARKDRILIVSVRHGKQRLRPVEIVQARDIYVPDDPVRGLRMFRPLY